MAPLRRRVYASRILPGVDGGRRYDIGQRVCLSASVWTRLEVLAGRYHRIHCEGMGEMERVLRMLRSIYVCQ
jgi:hypothetical protein